MCISTYSTEITWAHFLVNSRIHIIHIHTSCCYARSVHVSRAHDRVPVNTYIHTYM